MEEKQNKERHADKCEMCARTCKQPAFVEVLGCPDFVLYEDEENPQEADKSKQEVS